MLAVLSLVVQILRESPLSDSEFAVPPTPVSLCGPPPFGLVLDSPRCPSLFLEVRNRRGQRCFQGFTGVLTGLGWRPFFFFFFFSFARPPHALLEGGDLIQWIEPFCFQDALSRPRIVSGCFPPWAGSMTSKGPNSPS